MIHKPSLESLDVPKKNLGPIGSAVLTFIGYKQTDKQTDRQTSQIYISRDLEISSKPVSFVEKRYL